MMALPPFESDAPYTKSIWPPTPRIELRAQRVGAYLSRDVYLQGRVDGRHAVVLRDDVGIVGVAHVHHQYGRVVVDEVVDALRTHQERRDHLALVDILGFAVDYAALHQRKHAVGEHLGMDAEVLVAAQLRQHGIGNGADAHLQRRAVLDQGCAVLADGRLGLVRLGEVRLHQRSVVLHEIVDLRRVDHGLSEGAGNVLVHHGEHVIGGLHGGQRRVYRGAERYEAVFVGRRYLNHRHVAGNRAAAVQALRLAQENRNVVGVAALRHFADVAAHEERVELEHAFEFLVGIGRRAFGVQVVDVYVLQFTGLAARAHGVDKALGSRSHGTQVYVVARFDNLDGFFGSGKFDLGSHFYFKFVLVLVSWYLVCVFLYVVFDGLSE